MRYLINLFLLYPSILNAATGISKYIDDPDEPVPGTLEGGLLSIVISFIVISLILAINKDKDKFGNFLGTLLFLIWWSVKFIFFIGLLVLYAFAIDKLSRFISFEIVGKSDGWFFLIMFVICYFMPIYLYWNYSKGKNLE
jgi:hypothetical protein